MTRSLCYVEKKVRDLPMYDGLSKAGEMGIACYTRKMVGMHRRSFEEWRECRKMTSVWFGKP